jgi:RNA polymerase sigma factor (sigma-70 family)
MIFEGELTFEAARAFTSEMSTALPPFEEIVSRHGATVLRVCRAVLRPLDADDAWSETFLAALRAYPTLRPGSNVEAWLVTIAHRKAIDQTRAGAGPRRPLPVDTLPEGPAPRDAGGRDDDLWAAMQALPFKQRVAVAYHYVAGMPYAEVAALVGGSEDAARRAAADGIATLRKTYGEASRRR